MKQKYLYLFLLISLPLISICQITPTPGNVPKDAGVNVTITNFTGKVLPNEIVVFKSKANGTEYQGLSDVNGKFSLRLPQGDKYDIYILGFHDSASYNELDIPALANNKFYSQPFTENIQFEPAGSFILDNCNFETGKADLTPEAFPVLDELVAYLTRKDDDKVEIGGYTDNVGSAANNLILSQNRANTVRAYLLTKGIAPDRVTAKGYGASNPIADNRYPDGRAQNRRIEVKTLY